MTGTQTTSSVTFSSSGKTALGTLAAVLVAPVWFGLGLIAPLTPSQGAPSVLSLLGFWLAPMALLAGVWFWDRSVLGRTTASGLLLLILAPYSWWILLPIYGLR